MKCKWNDFKLRGSDPEGSGAFMAPRGTRKHVGTDYFFKPGDPVPAPADGVIIRLGYAYAGDSLRLVEMLSHNGLLLWRFLYVLPSVKPGDKVVKDQTIGTAQDVTKRYSPQMKNHVHVEVYVNPHRLLGGVA